MNDNQIETATLDNPLAVFAEEMRRTFTPHIAGFGATALLLAENFRVIGAAINNEPEE